MSCIPPQAPRITVNLADILTRLARESGVDEAAAQRFPGGKVTYGSAASGREIPIEEGGDIQKGTGRITKAEDFEGEGGPEDQLKRKTEERPGDDDIRSNVRN